MHDVQGKHGPFGLGNLKGPAADRLSGTLRSCGSLEEGIKRDALLTYGLPPPPDRAPGPRSLVPGFILRLPPSGGSLFRPLVPGQSLFNLGQSFIHFRPPHHHVPEASNGA